MTPYTYKSLYLTMGVIVYAYLLVYLSRIVVNAVGHYLLPKTTKSLTCSFRLRYINIVIITILLSQGLKS